MARSELVWIHRVRHACAGMEQHQHDAHELVVPRSLKPIIAWCSGTRLEAACGATLLHPACVRHQVQLVTNCDVLVCQWRGALPLKASTCIPDSRGRLLSTATWMWEASNRFHSGGPALAQQLLGVLLAEIDHHLMPQQPSEGEEIERLVQHRMAERVSIRALANDLDLTERRLTELTWACFGLPPAKYLHAVRCRQARHLIEHSALSFVEVARATGAANANLLSRWMTTAYGSSPRTLRRRAQENAPLPPPPRL